MFYKSSVLKVGAAFCAGKPIKGELLSSKGESEDSIISHAVFERPELHVRFSKILIIDENTENEEIKRDSVEHNKHIKNKLGSESSETARFQF